MFFFFKQKTAYEMRISDWSSDVCSSDLDRGRDRRTADPPPGPGGTRAGDDRRRDAGRRRRLEPRLSDREGHLVKQLRAGHQRYHRPRARAAASLARPRRPQAGRSEEHTSELQSLMRISYAVFCLKKKK